MSDIKVKYSEIIKDIPDNVTLVAATKSRTVDEILEAIDAGVQIVGENYVQEAVHESHLPYRQAGQEG